MSTPTSTRAANAAAALVLWLIILGGAATFAAGLLRAGRVPLTLLLLVMALGIVAEVVRVRVDEGQTQDQAIAVSLSTALHLFAVGTGGFAAATLCAAFTAVTHDLLLRRSRRVAPAKRLFNLFNPIVSAGVAAGLFAAIAGRQMTVSTLHMAAGAAAAVAYYLTNTGLVMVMISLHSGRPLLAVWRENLWFAPVSILQALIGAFVGAAFHALGWMGALLFAAPVLLLRYIYSLYAHQAQRRISAMRQSKEEVERAHAKQRRTMGELIETMGAIIDARDCSTYGHSRQVARYAGAIARQLGLSEVETDTIRTAALLHDLGKVGVPEAILNKPERLTPQEYAQIKEHAALGERLLAEISDLGGIARIVGEHHERYDGKGYPRGLSGTAISLGGRIICVSDCIDSMLSDRPYSRGRPLDEVIAELERCAGTHFDPRVVEAVEQLLAEHGPEFFINSASPAQHRAEAL